MKVTPEVKTVLQRTIEAYGNVSQFAKAVGVAHSTVLFWLSGKSPNINGRVWIKKIRPAVLPFLTPEEENLLAPDCKVLREPQAPYGQRLPLGAMEQKPVTVPCLPLDKISGLDVTIEPITEFIQRIRGLRNCQFTRPVKDSYFALEYDVENLPFKLNALIGGGDYPVSGGLALAKLRESGRVIAGRFIRDGEQISLETTFTDTPETISWNLRTSPGYLCWIFPILEVNAILPAK